MRRFLADACLEVAVRRFPKTTGYNSSDTHGTRLERWLTLRVRVAAARVT